MSLGTSNTFTGTCDNYIPGLTTVIKELRDINIATVIASGNSYAYGMSSPACISYAVSVAATYKTTNLVTDYSNINQYTTLAAPGSAINSAKTGATYGTASGTSMATPFIAGAFAVYRSKFGVQSVSKVVTDFQSAGKPALDNYTNITVQRLDFKSMFVDSPPISTTTTTSTTTTSTTTTIPSTTSTTTTVPSTTTTTIAPPPVLPFIPKPILLEINGIGKTFIWVKYRDPYMNKAFISHYILYCNGSKAYRIPKEDMYSLHSYYLAIPASEINYCYLYGVTIFGTRTGITQTMNIYPKNK
jgi:subtilisin family serine protease